MIVPLIVILFTITFSIILTSQFEGGESLIIGFLSFICSILIIAVSCSIRNSNNPNFDEYLDLRSKYVFVTKNDSVPMSMKMEIYEKLKDFNEKVDENKKYGNDIFVAYYYPDMGYELTKFDLEKLK